MSTPHRLTFFEPRDYRVVFVDTIKGVCITPNITQTPATKAKILLNAFVKIICPPCSALRRLPYSIARNSVLRSLCRRKKLLQE